MRSKLDVAKLIRSFVSGTSGEWDWDDFISVPQSDSKIEALRQRIMSIHKEYPPKTTKEYCNADGIKELSRIAESLEASDNA